MKSVTGNLTDPSWNISSQAMTPSMIAGSIEPPPVLLLPVVFRPVPLAFQSPLFLALAVSNISSRFSRSWSSAIEHLLVWATVLVADIMIFGYT